MDIARMNKFFKNRVFSMKCALNGIFQFFRGETHAKIHLFFSVLVITISLLLGISPIDWVLICIAIGLVIVSEMLNTAIEKIVDLISPNYNERAGVIKDISAGAVLIAIFVAIIIGCVVFIKYII